MDEPDAFGLALDHHTNGRFTEAIPAYNQALEGNEYNPDIRNNLGVALCQHDRLSEGISQFRLALRYEKDDPSLRAEILGNLGFALLQQEDFINSIDTLLQAVAINPEDGDVRLALGQAYARNLAPSQAALQLDIALLLQPDSNEVKAELQALALAKVRPSDALRLVEVKLKQPSADNETVRPGEAALFHGAPLPTSVTELGHTEVEINPPLGRELAEKNRSNSAYIGSSDASLLPQSPRTPFRVQRRLLRPHSVEKLLVLSEMDRLAAILSHHDFSDETAKIIEKKNDLGDDSVLVFVVGEGNFGKSSLINAILGRTVAEVSFRPLTWRIDLFHPLPEGFTEYAEVRRSGRAGLELMSIKEAEDVCHLQEKSLRQAKAAGFGETISAKPSLAFMDQIIEVHWYYTGLSVADNIVLVDTPGFAQVRPGQNTADVVTLASAEGVVFDIGEIYDAYYHRANCVLWAFKATKINDEDTNKVFGNLSRQNKDIMGVATCVDRVPQNQRGDLMKRLSELYGERISTFVPVVAGGDSDLFGMGIGECRDYLSHLAMKAEAIQLDETRRFMAYEGECASNWLFSIGETLISNVSEISLYCNATAGELLAELRRTRDALSQKMQTLVIRQADSEELTPRIRSLLLEEIPKQDGAKAAKDDVQARNKLSKFYQQTLRSFLHLTEMESEIAGQFRRADAFVVSAGAQQSAGRRLKQIVLKQGGEVETRSLVSRILSPDLTRYRIDLPELDLPLVSTQLFEQLLLEVSIVGGLIGGLGCLGSLVGCGCAPIALPLLLVMVPVLYSSYKEEKKKQDQAVLQAVAESQRAVGMLPQRLGNIIQEHTKGVASAIIDSADIAIGKVYQNKNLTDLRQYAGQIDSDLRTLTKFGEASGSTSETRESQFQILYQMWSPRDDARAAAIEVFCDWFEKGQDGYQADATGWLSDAIHENPLERKRVQRFCKDYLSATKQKLGMKFAQRAGDLNTPAGNTEERLLRPWMSRLQLSLKIRRLFPEQENSLQEQFENISLDGITASLTDAMIGRYEMRARDLLSEQLGSVSVSSDVKGRENSWRSFVRWFVPICPIFSLFVGSTCGFLTRHSHGLKTAVLYGFAASLSAMLILVAAGLFIWVVPWQLQERRRILADLTDTLYNAIDSIPGVAWAELMPDLGRQFARSVVGQKTLVKPRILDYAIEGLLDVPLSNTTNEPLAAGGGRKTVGVKARKRWGVK